MMLAVWLSALAAASPLVQSDAPLFSRPEPQLERGAALLRRGDADGALEAFRRANGANANQRAIVEYDVGQALVEQAQQSARAAPAAEGGPAKVDVSNARAAFDRAFSLASDPALKSEAQLASGNAAALGGDVDAAIAAYRKALVADPNNERAKKNLLRALAAKRAQPPPPPEQGGDNQDDQKQDDEQDDKQDEQKDQQKQGEQKNDEQKNDEQKNEQEQDQQKDQQQKDQQKKQQDAQDQEDAQDAGPGGAQPQPKPQRKEDAKKLLDALRSREKPLSPLEMRGTNKTRPKTGKDW